MIVSRIALSNFLNYSSVAVEFVDGINMIVGENASGKTNLADGVLLASIGKSSRHTKDKELISWNSSKGAQVTLKIKKRFSSHIVDIIIDKDGDKHIAIDSLPIRRIGELMGVLNVVFFSPSELALVNGTPQDRRRFLNISLSQQSKVYFYALQNYVRLLGERNKIIKQYKDTSSIQNLISITNAPLAREASILVSERNKFISRLSDIAREKHRRLTSNKEDLSITYETNAGTLDDPKTEILALLEKSYSRDLRLEHTTIGPHLDDLKIAANDIDLRKFGSQGQQRTAVLSLKLAEVSLFKERTGEAPVLILDDVMSELDEMRRRSLLESLSNVQTLITCTEPTKEASTGYGLFKVQNCDIARCDHHDTEM
ncbi:MAG: DNA replication/repair protein RecF [Christensenellaceae bacterium]|jgi:DNA replication and repair protein RecF|nr:DNA replication/repair protein RecF [Christensenellaceae bacterium]